MKLTRLPNEFKKALPVINQLTQAGYEAYFVGGCVRDAILGLPIHDVDIATSAFPAEIKEVFEKTIDVGIEHGTVLVLSGDESYEITTFRTESTYQDYRRPDHVDFVRSLEEDLKRRDFTINALALAHDGSVIDLFDGLNDLKNRCLRAVGQAQDRFQEDALRMMRGLRFISQLDFQLEAKTKEAICNHAELLTKISVERICIEFEKLLVGKNRSQALALFIETNCFKYCPQLTRYEKQLSNFAQVANHQLHDVTVAWAAILTYFNMPLQQVRPFLKAWKTSNQLIIEVQLLLQMLIIRKQRIFNAIDLYQLNEDIIPKLSELCAFYQLSEPTNLLLQRYQALPIHQLKDLAINGHDLMTYFNRRGGSWLKQLLSLCESAVLMNEIKNEYQELLSYANSKMDCEKID
ncbi:MAG TPA: CCA tRNA nucleotidyltransferase [Enterococcus columbae]|nr:CCA tRNA nucleotidyltransferase [Enterococcus columbae]